MTARDNEGGVFQVVEAILVAVLIASTLVFFALVQKPTPAPTSPGLDLARIAGDALSILQGDDPGGASDGLQDSVEVLIPTASDANKTLLRDKVSAVLPDGLRFLLRAHSDAGSALVYGPSDIVSDPRNAQGAVTYVMDGPDLVLVELVVWNAF